MFLGRNDGVDRNYQVRSPRISLRLHFRHYRTEQQGGAEEDRDLEQHQGYKFYEELQGRVHSNRGESSKQNFHCNNYTGKWLKDTHCFKIFTIIMKCNY